MVAAIYSVFDGVELLPYSVANMRPLVEGIIIVHQLMSNIGEPAPPLPDLENVDVIIYTPNLSLSAGENERLKRDYGLQYAKHRGFTHFLDIDCDEFYIQDEFLKEKERVLKGNLNGLVCRSKVYFASPTLTIGTDVTLVTFLCKICDTKHGISREMPFAWTDMDGVPFTPKKRIRIDPTRQLNIRHGIEWSNIFMHHYSWIRKDYGMKIRNSSARINIERSTVLQDLLSAKDGHYCEFYGKHLTSCPNVFGLPEWQNQNNPGSAAM